MTKQQLIELTVIEGLCGGGALASLCFLAGLLTRFGEAETAGIALGLGAAAVAAVVSSVAGRGAAQA